MKFKKGSGIEWEHMIVDDNSKVCLGVHYFDKKLKVCEKNIVARHLQNAAKEIEKLREIK